jgi:hypothetical protein
MRNLPDAAECRRLAEEAEAQAEKLPPGPVKKSLQIMAREYEFHAKVTSWASSPLHRSN